MTMFPHCELFPVKQCMDPEHCSSLGTGDDDDEQMGESMNVLSTNEVSNESDNKGGEWEDISKWQLYFLYMSSSI